MKTMTVHIFIIENENLFIDLLEYVFTKDYKYRFIDFTSGKECVENLVLEPDFIILDSKLPDQAGIDVLKEIKRNRPEVKVIMLLNDEEKSPPFLGAGAEDAIFKNSELKEKLIKKLETLFILNELEYIPDAKKKKKPSLEKIHYSV